MREACFAANMFHRMFKNGNVLNPEVGMRYRKLLLEPGASKDGIELLQDFLGEDIDDSYFLIENGLKTLVTQASV